ncbi:uncharacterized protein LOC132116864 [Carassius carassius]|uniref:uncharacterized protein LOC132116864 n=1 Tax=Carassius carassius TaxID=217509 RepID=UPI002868FE52|nr:uncharacterized protein LOC132116864 [Carassius carassius]XP_059381710.1 uncharacterized protein LOC132116864 [Carassius carassius]
MNGENQTLMDEHSVYYSDYPNNYTTDYYDIDVPNETQCDSSDIRMSIFLIASVCVGLPALVWAFPLLHLHRKIRGRISVFILLLLLNDLIQLPLYLYIMTNILTEYRYYIDALFQFWFGLHWCGFHLHQLVALEGILTLKYPLWSARIFSLPSYILISILVLFFSIVSALFLFKHSQSTNMSLFSLSTSVVPLIVLAVSSTISCKASSTPVRKNSSVLTVAILTFVLMYSPFMLIIWVDFFHLYRYVNLFWFIISYCLMNLRVISDPILCVLVCRENLRDVQTPQTHTEPNADDVSLNLSFISPHV